MIDILRIKVELNINCSKKTIESIIVLSLFYKVTAIEKFITLQDRPIYILIWTGSELPPFMYMVSDRMQKCLFKNCFVTNEKSYFDDVKQFDVILFNVVDLKNLKLPDERSKHQIYVFVSQEPPILAPVPSEYNGFFNLTWTYQLNSDITLRYIVVKDKKGKVIGPHSDMQWMDVNDMKPISKKVKLKLENKKFAAAWFVSNCFNTPSGRQYYIEHLKKELDKYNLRADSFGSCGEQYCPNNPEGCHSVLESDYYFYLSFENSICEDYVTEKVLTATKHFTVPIVYGGANYTKFLPNGAYLNARNLEPDKLAYIMNDTIHNKNKYYDFFKWHRYYSLHDPSESPETDEICALCTFLNKQKHVYRSNVYENISAFWSE